MSIRPDMEPLADQLGCAPSQPDSAAKQFLGALYPRLLEIAKRERSTVVIIAREILRKELEAGR